MELNNKSLFKQECFIGGKWVNSISGETIEVENPATQETIGIVPKCDAQETKTAIESANNALKIGKTKLQKKDQLF